MVAIFFVLLGVVADFGVYPQYVLRVVDTNTGEMILEEVVSPGDEFSVALINSVENLPTTDVFLIDDDYGIIFSEIITQAQYAGFICEERAEVIAPGTTRIADINQPMDEVTFFNGYYGQHTIILHGMKFPIYQLAPGGDVIRLRVEKSSRLSRLLGKKVEG